MGNLNLTTIQAPNADHSVEIVANYLAKKLEISVDFVVDISWEERDIKIDKGEIEIGWICGLPYINKFDRPNSQIELLAAPVMTGERYQDKPIYFSDVVVRLDSAFFSFKDLRGTKWAYNEPNSQSGYNITRYHLAVIGEPKNFFGKVIKTGSHQRALKLIRQGRVDAAAIDSTVLETEFRNSPEIRDDIRILEALGPSPIPPYVISTQVPKILREQIRDLITHMHQDNEGSSNLQEVEIARFEIVSDSDYDIIREMVKFADNQGVKL